MPSNRLPVIIGALFLILNLVLTVFVTIAALEHEKFEPSLLHFHEMDPFWRIQFFLNFPVSFISVFMSPSPDYEHPPATRNVVIFRAVFQTALSPFWCYYLTLGVRKIVQKGRSLV